VADAEVLPGRGRQARRKKSFEWTWSEMTRSVAAASSSAFNIADTLESEFYGESKSADD
jgi:hypothetical protein